MKRAATVLVIFLLVGCAPSLLVTGETLDFTAQEFAKVGATYNQLLDAKQITPDQYQAWYDFAIRFKAAWPLAETAWQAAKKANDQAALKHSTGIINGLRTELLNFVSALASGQQGAKQ